MAGTKGPREFGRIRRLPSKSGKGRFQAFYSDPEGAVRTSRTGKFTPVRHTAPFTFETQGDAEAWLVDERRLISRGEWTPPAARRIARQAAEAASVLPTFTEYAMTWIAERKVKGRPLAPKTRDHYDHLLETYLSPAFGALPIDAVTPQVVTAWYDAFTPVTQRGRKKKGAPSGATTKAHAYSFGRAVMNTAVAAHGPLVGHVNPFAVRGGGSSPTAKREELATSAEMEIMLAIIKPKWRALLELGLWTGLRYGEIVALRRGDVDLTNRVVKVRRSISRTKSEGVIAKAPKSDAGVRDQRIPANLVPVLREHLREHVGRSKDALLFATVNGTPVSSALFYGATKKGKLKPDGWYAARTAAGHPTLHFHDLRATGATLLAQQGATEAEIQAFLGDSTPQAAQRYVRAARSRMDMLTNKMAEVAASGKW